MQELFLKRNNYARRESSYDVTGGNRDRITLAPQHSHSVKIEGSGIIRHIWFTFGHTSSETTSDYRKLFLAISFDNLGPQIEMSVADFFGLFLGEIADIDSEYFQVIKTVNHPIDYFNAKPYYGGFNCYFPMPFFKSCEISMLNCDSSEWVWYYHIDWEESPLVPADALYFNATLSDSDLDSSNPSTANNQVDMSLCNLSDAQNHMMLNLDGYEGHYMGVSMLVDSPPNAHGRWWEGDEMIFVDSREWPPMIHGTGTEDYFCLAYGIRRVLSCPQFGVTAFEKDQNSKSQTDGRFGLYRFHSENPIVFKRSIRLSLEHGHANESNAHYRSVAFWYGRKL